jgi:hypothetical protein
MSQLIVKTAKTAISQNKNGIEFTTLVYAELHLKLSNTTIKTNIYLS